MKGLGSRPCYHPPRGFSIFEMLVSVFIMLVVSAIAIPSLVRSMHLYRLDNATSQLAGVLQAARYEAVRKNISVKCIAKSGSGTSWSVWVDSNGNNSMDPTEKQVLFSSRNTLISSGAIPTSSSLAGAVGSNITLTALSGSNSSVTFDPRGSVNFNIGASSVYVFYIGDASELDYGYRAVVLLPSGSTQIWSGSENGSWHR